MAKLTYEIEMSPENAGKIDAINKILLGAAYTEEAPAKPAPKAEKPAAKAVPAKEEKADDSISLTEFRNAAKAAKAEFGEEFAVKVLKDCGVAVKDTLGRSTSSASADQYEEIIAAWQAGPQESEEEESEEEELDDDDGLGDDDDLDGEEEAEVDAEAVKTALKAYSKEHGRDAAKEIMTKHGAAALSKVDDLPAAKLAAMMKELV